jgi:elongation factor P hydroxylase
MALWTDFVLPLLALKPHKRLYFQRGFDALTLMKQGLSRRAQLFVKRRRLFTKRQTIDAQGFSCTKLSSI